jgi:hypothetical protein
MSKVPDRLRGLRGYAKVPVNSEEGATHVEWHPLKSRQTDVIAREIKRDAFPWNTEKLSSNPIYFAKLIDVSIKSTD